MSAVTDPDSHSDIREGTQIDAVCNEYVDTACSLNPLLATYVGVPGFDDKVVDYSPDAEDERAAATAAFGAAVAAITPVDHVDEVTQWAVAERTEISAKLHDAGESYGNLNVVVTPVQELRDIVEVMPTETADDWSNVAKRLRQYDTSLGGYQQSLRHAMAHGKFPAHRQVVAVLEQIDQMTNPNRGYFARMLDKVRPHGKTADPALLNDMSSAVDHAVAAFTDLHAMLTTEVLPQASDVDGCGEDTYRLHLQYFIGSDVDLQETYEWGIEELARTEKEMAKIASKIVPGGSVQDAIDALDRDPTRSIDDAEAFREWMQATADEAIVALSGVHFDIPDQIQSIECRFAGSGSGGIYYTGPSEDFSRPGRMWWAVPPGQTHFGTWHERTTVYHEGVPGHHLQIGQTMVRQELLNRWRRMMSWVSGHGEGWALYAERLMADLGFLDDPGDRMGMLAASAFRAMRVVGDIGVHCHFDVPAELGSGKWDADALWKWIRIHGRLPEGVARFEHLRYLGWPGQAPSYKVGERLWMTIRQQREAALGSSFDLKRFHRDALDVGSVGLDVLDRALSQPHS